jgi:hypothetical protein
MRFLEEDDRAVIVGRSPLAGPVEMVPRKVLQAGLSLERSDPACGLVPPESPHLVTGDRPEGFANVRNDHLRVEAHMQKRTNVVAA